MAEIPTRPVRLIETVRDWWSVHVVRHGWGRTSRIFLAEIWNFLRESTPEQRRRRYGDVEYDWDHRVDTTSATVLWRDRLLGVFHSPYQPTEPALFDEMLRALPIDYSEFVFIDLGSGKGRTLLMAADYPFRRVIGVELLSELNRVAQNNLEKYSSPTQHCFAIESRCGDAREFVFPAEPVVLYLSNPLPEQGLATVLHRLERSWREHPRKVLVLYHNPLLEHLFAERDGWLKKIGGTHQYCIYASV